MAGRIDVYSGVITGVFVFDCSLRTSPVPVLTGVGVEVRQSCPLGSVHFDVALFGCIGCPADIDIVLNGVVYTLTQRPAVLCLDLRATQNSQTYEYIFFHSVPISYNNVGYLSLFSAPRTLSLAVRPLLTAILMPSLMPTSICWRLNFC